MMGSLPGRPLLVVLLAACVGLAACGDRDVDDGTGGFVECVVPRPEVCAQDWLPVCGKRDTGIRCVTTPCDSWELRTYSNACTACADRDVYGWRPGECPEDPPDG